MKEREKSPNQRKVISKSQCLELCAGWGVRFWSSLVACLRKTQLKTRSILRFEGTTVKSATKTGSVMCVVLGVRNKQCEAKERDELGDAMNGAGSGRVGPDNENVGTLWGFGGVEET